MESYMIERRRTAIRFVALALAAQVLLCLVLSVPTLEKQFPLYLRLAAEPVTVGDRSFADYYPLRRRIAESTPEVLILGVDFQCAQTYVLLPDLIEAVKNEVDIGSVIFDGPGDSAQAAALVSAEDEETRTALAAALGDVPELYTEFLLTLSRMKVEYPPKRQYSGVALTEGESSLTIARACVQKSGRPVLVITDTALLDSGSGFRSAVDSQKNMMPVQCCYREGLLPFGERQPGIFIVDSDFLSGFDALYANAARGADGGFSRTVYSEIYSTDVSFLIIDGTPVGEVDV